MYLNMIVMRNLNPLFILLMIHTIVAQQLLVSVYVDGGDQVLIGSAATLKCEFEGINLDQGDSTLTIAWRSVLNDTIIRIASYIYGNPIDYPSDGYQPPAYNMTIDYGEQSGSSELAIQSLTLHNNGVYWCSVATTNGIWGNANAAIVVNVPPLSITLSSSVEHTNNSVVSVISDVAKIFICVARGSNPPSTILWTLDGLPQPGWPSDDMDTSNISLIPKYKDHDVTLQCRATVPADNVGLFTNVILYVSELPELPRNVDILTDSSTTNSLTVQWTRGHNGGATQWFLVQYRQGGMSEKIESGNITELVDQDVYNHTINELLAGELYFVTLSSGNIYGQTNGVEVLEPGITIPTSPEEREISMIYSQETGALSVSGLPQDGDTTTCLLIQTTKNAGSTWEDWLCIDTNEDSLKIPNHDAIDTVRGMYCVREICGEASLSEGLNGFLIFRSIVMQFPVISCKPTNDIVIAGRDNPPAVCSCSCTIPIIIGAASSGVLASIIIIIIAMMCCRRMASNKVTQKNKEDKVASANAAYEDLDPSTRIGSPQYEHKFIGGIDDIMVKDDTNSRPYEMPPKIPERKLSEKQFPANMQATNIIIKEHRYQNAESIDTGSSFQ